MLEALSKRYLTSLSIFTVGLLAGVLLINSIVDPLWYFGGNLITGKNFGFNERLSKINYFFKNPDAYDCFIFGSSRDTLLDQNKVEGHRCMNFSWALGRVGEFVSYASYFKRKGYHPRLVIVGVSGFNFQLTNEEQRGEVVDFIAKSSGPPGFLASYLTLDAIRFSVLTLRGRSPSPRYYKTDLSVGILCNAPAYDPRKSKGTPELDDPDKFDPSNVHWYKKLMEVYPDAKFVFYVPPISVWIVRALQEDGRLNSYLKSIYAVSRVAPVLYDFSIPSAITADPSRTYDGDHYDTDVNELIVKTMNSGTPKFGIEVQGLTFSNYKTQYLNALSNQKAPVDSRSGSQSSAGICVSSA
jgi:hypothetical protein